MSTIVQQIKGIQFQQDACIMSYDVKALFTSVPKGPAIKIIQDQLDQDKELQQRTSMTVNKIICPLEFCLRNTYFLFQCRNYEQLEVAAMGSPISPIVANLYMEFFKSSPQHITPPPKSVEKIHG